MAKNTRANWYQSVLRSSKRTQTLLKFPLDLETEGTGNIMRFSFNLPEGSQYLGGEYKRARDPATGQVKRSVYRRGNNDSSITKRFSQNYTRTQTHVDLYMPPNITSSYQANWGEESLGMLGAFIDAGGKLSQLDGDYGKMIDVVKNTLSTQAMNAFSGTLTALTPFDVNSAKRAYNSSLSNPYTEVLFNGVQNRNFSFTFKMIPRNAKEQESIEAIVKEFKFHSAPELKFSGQSNYWFFPSEVDIKFLNSNATENDHLFKISTCALTNVEVNHSPEGQYASHADGSPFATEMTIELIEMEQLTKQRINDGY